MKIRSIEIQNFRAIKTRRLTFEDGTGHIRPVTVLAGPNGCGKTSVLYSIINALRGLAGYRTDEVPEPHETDIHRSGKLGSLSRVPHQIGVRLSVEFVDSEVDAIQQVFEDTKDLYPGEKVLPFARGPVTIEWRYPPEPFPDGSDRPSWYVHVSPREAFLWFHGRSHAVRGWLTRRLRNRELLDNVGALFFFPQDRNLQSRVVGNGGELHHETDVRELGNEVRDETADRRKADTERPMSVQPIWGILSYLASYARMREGTLSDNVNWEKRIQEQFTKICGPKEYLGFLYQPEDPVGAPYFKDGESVYPLNMAASGEQVVIEYITRLNYPSPLNNSIILIDEPEVHLHPRWIRQLYQALPHIGSNNQYILTTHSSELRGLAAEDNALIDMAQME